MKVKIAEDLEQPFRERFTKMDQEVELFRSEYNKLRYEHSFVKSEYEHQQVEHKRVIEEMKLQYEAEVGWCLVTQFTYFFFRLNKVCQLILPSSICSEGRGMLSTRNIGLRGWGPDSGRWGRFMKAIKLFSNPSKTKIYKPLAL